MSSGPYGATGRCGNVKTIAGNQILPCVIAVLFDLAQQAQNSGALTRTPNIKLNATGSL
jgi:hypothetical protein